MHIQKPCYLYLLTLFILFFINATIMQCHSQDKMNGPFKPKTAKQPEEYGEGQDFILNIYQQYISPVKGGNKCPMYPSCSQYAKNAFDTLPWHEAYIKSLERLLRCGKEIYPYQMIRIKGKIRLYDPVLEKEEKHEDKKLQVNP